MEISLPKIDFCSLNKSIKFNYTDKNQKFSSMLLRENLEPSAIVWLFNDSCEIIKLYSNINI